MIRLGRDLFFLRPDGSETDQGREDYGTNQQGGDDDGDADDSVQCTVQWSDDEILSLQFRLISRQPNYQTALTNCK